MNIIKAGSFFLLVILKMSKKLIWSCLIAWWILFNCWNNSAKDNESLNDNPVEDDIEFLQAQTSDDISQVILIKYPAKYKDWDAYDMKWNKISKNSDWSVQEILEDIENPKDSLQVDSLLNDSLQSDSIIIEDLPGDSIIQEDPFEEILEDEYDDLLKKQSENIDSNNATDDIERLKKSTGNEVYITIDDWPWPYTEEIARKLSELWHKVTFFFIGNQVKGINYPAIWVVDSLWHEIWNHSYSHPSFKNLWLSQAKDQLDKTEDNIKECWVTPAPYFRYPYGNSFPNKKAFESYVNAKWYNIVNWDIDTRDWSSKTSKQDLINRMKNVKPWDVILIHERKYTVDKTIPVIDSMLHVKWLHSVPYRKVEKPKSRSWIRNK